MKSKVNRFSANMATNNEVL